MTIEQAITTYVADAWLDGNAEDLDADLPLAETNIIDSAAMFDLAHFLQGRFQVRVPLEEITPENFATIKAIARLVERLRTAQAGPRATEMVP